MAVSPDKSTNPKADVQNDVGRDPQVAELADRVSELEILVQEQAATIHNLMTSQLAAVGADPAGAARRALGRSLVQFRRNYNRMAQPSSIKDAPNVVDGYSVGALEVVRLRDDERARIEADFPDLLETRQDKFRPFPRQVPKMVPDEHGRPRWTMTVVPVPVDELIAKAPAVG